MTEEKVYSEFKYENELLSPFNYIQQVKGKQLRVKIILAFNYWFKVPSEKVHQILDVLNMLHNAALIVDDIEDESSVRRGLPAAHCVYGLPMTINAAFHALFLALEKLSKISPKAGEILIEHFLEVVRGQGLDIYWRDNCICPTEAQYMDMAQRKNGAYLVMAVRLLQSFSEDKTDYTNLALTLGKYFQIREDYCNIGKQEALEEWPGSEDTHARETSYFEDLTEGKFSFPVVHASNTPDGNQILNILRKRTRDANVKKYCISLLEKSGSLQYTRDVLLDLDKAARAEVARLGGNPKMEVVLDELLSWQDQYEIIHLLS
ncbi:geranylgeranyl pyrophosphate synthase-like [Maniola jurtina]|uniref:geranylgeranyl pyrophosphate synthase-like n=1 Tax=Maniola jurtina TaxID=191418 RepID=UPI001E68A424|nr:geranylgeranyl pyrophosphate synthase-like [Maniola jurtina]